MLPPITSTLRKVLLDPGTRSSTPWECPWAVSTTSTSTPASASSSARSSVPSPTPIAAPTRSRPNVSLAASGCSVDLRMSFTVIRPRSSKSSLMTSTRSSRCLCISALASSVEAPSRTVTSRSRGVMMSRHGLVEIGLETQVAVGHNADHAAAFDHRHAGNLVLASQVEHFAHRHGRRNGDRILEDAGLEPLDLGDLAPPAPWGSGSCARCRYRLPAPGRWPGGLR